MNDNRDQCDSLLRDHLSSELDGQTGRAGAKFLELQMRQRPAHRLDYQQVPRGRTRLLRWVGISSGLAALAAIAVGVLVMRPPPPQAMLTGPGSALPPRVLPETSLSVPVEQIVEFRTVDEGTVVLEGEGPARQVRRQMLQTVQYYDPQRNANIEITVPREQVVFVGLQPY